MTFNSLFENTFTALLIKLLCALSLVLLLNITILLHFIILLYFSDLLSIKIFPFKLINTYNSCLIYFVYLFYFIQFFFCVVLTLCPKNKDYDIMHKILLNLNSSTFTVLLFLSCYQKLTISSGNTFNTCKYRYI